jgi:hypothetical protein
VRWEIKDNLRLPRPSGAYHNGADQNGLFSRRDSCAVRTPA